MLASWRLDAQDQRVGRAGFPRGPAAGLADSLALLCPHSVAVLTCLRPDFPFFTRTLLTVDRPPPQTLYPEKVSLGATGGWDCGA